MAVAYIAQAGFSSGTDSVTLPYPAGAVAGTIAVAVVDSGHPGPSAYSTPATPDGWALIGTFVDSTGGYGPDAGQRRVTLFIRLLQGDDTEPQFVIPADTDSRVGGNIVAFSKDEKVLRYAAAGGQDASSGTGFSVTAATGVEFAVADFVLLAAVANTDAATWSAQAITAAGITFGTVTERADSQSAVGADASRTIATCEVTAGADIVAPTIGATLSSAATGVAAALRLRDAPAGAGPGGALLGYAGFLDTRIQIQVSGLDANADRVMVERSVNQVTWVTVRGGTAVDVSTMILVGLPDYEFAPDVVNYYRVTASDAGGVITDQETASITPELAFDCGTSAVWIKSIARPFLNQRVQVVQRPQMAVTRPARTGVFDVVGRTLPIAVNDVRKSRRWTMYVRTETAVERDNFDYLMASGDVLFIQTPASSTIPGGYVTVGDVEQSWHPLRPLHVTYTLPVVEVAPPGPDVVGASVTWQSVINSYSDWLATGVAHSSWADLLTLVGSPSEVIVP